MSGRHAPHPRGLRLGRRRLRRCRLCRGVLRRLGAGACAPGAPAPEHPPGSGTADLGWLAARVESATVRIFCARSTARSIPAGFTFDSYLFISTIWSGAGTGTGCASPAMTLSRNASMRAAARRSRSAGVLAESASDLGSMRSACHVIATACTKSRCRLAYSSGVGPIFALSARLRSTSRSRHLLHVHPHDRIGHLLDLLRQLRGARIGHDHAREPSSGEVAAGPGRDDVLVVAMRDRILRERLRDGDRVVLDLHLGRRLRLRDVGALGVLAACGRPTCCAYWPLIWSQVLRWMMWKPNSDSTTLRDLAGLERRDRVAERLDHHAAREDAELAAALLASRDRRCTACARSAKFAGRDLRADRFRLAADRVLRRRRGAVGELEQDVARGVEIVRALLVARLRSAVARHASAATRSMNFWSFARSIMPLAASSIGLGVGERVTARGGGAEQLIGHPEVARDERRDLAVDRHADLGVAEHVAEPGDGQLLRAGARDHVHVGGEGLLETVAGDEGRRAEDEDAERKSFHETKSSKVRRQTSGDSAQSANEPVEQRGAAQARELERERVRAPHLRLELHLVKRRREPLHAGHRGIPKGNTGFVAAHQDPLDPERAPDHPQQCHREEWPRPAPGAGRTGRAARRAAPRSPPASS